MSEQQDNFVTNFSFMVMMMVSLAVMAVTFAIVADKLGDGGPDPAAGMRIQPVGQVALTDGTMFVSSSSVRQAPAEETEVKTESAPVAVVELDGEGVYGTACVTCHATGLAGAPKLADVEAWQPRLAQGIEVLYEHSLVGFLAMPPKGGFMNIPDDQIKLAVDYMVAAAK